MAGRRTPTQTTLKEAIEALRGVLAAVEAGEIDASTPRDIALLRRLQGTLVGWEEAPRDYSPTAAAAFSVNRLPSRVYPRSTVIDLCPVVAAMARSETPAAAEDQGSRRGWKPPGRRVSREMKSEKAAVERAPT